MSYASCQSRSTRRGDGDIQYVKLNLPLLQRPQQQEIAVDSTEQRPKNVLLIRIGSLRSKTGLLRKQAIRRDKNAACLQQQVKGVC